MSNPMSLTGGVEEYIYFSNLRPLDESLLQQKRYKSDESPYGRKVYFLNKNGYKTERENASKIFDEGQELTVKEIYVGRSSSTVEFLEYPDRKFNTVMFADKGE